MILKVRLRQGVCLIGPIKKFVTLWFSVFFLLLASIHLYPADALSFDALPECPNVDCQGGNDTEAQHLLSTVGVDTALLANGWEEEEDKTWIFMAIVASMASDLEITCSRTDVSNFTTIMHGWTVEEIEFLNNYRDITEKLKNRVKNRPRESKQTASLRAAWEFSLAGVDIATRKANLLLHTATLLGALSTTTRALTISPDNKPPNCKTKKAGEVQSSNILQYLGLDEEKLLPIRETVQPVIASSFDSLSERADFYGNLALIASIASFEARKHACTSEKNACEYARLYFATHQKVKDPTGIGCPPIQIPESPTDPAGSARPVIAEAGPIIAEMVKNMCDCSECDKKYKEAFSYKCDTYGPGFVCYSWLSASGCHSEFSTQGDLVHGDCWGYRFILGKKKYNDKAGLPIIRKSYHNCRNSCKSRCDKAKKFARQGQLDQVANTYNTPTRYLNLPTLPGESPTMALAPLQCIAGTGDHTTSGTPDLQDPTSLSNFPLSDETEISPVCTSVDKKGGFKQDPKCSCRPNCYQRRTTKFKTKKGHWSYQPISNVNSVVEAFRKHAKETANGNLKGLESRHDDLFKKTAKMASSFKHVANKLNKDLKKHGKKPISFKKSAANQFAKLKAAYNKGSDSIPQDQKGTFDIFGNVKPLSAGLGGKHAGASQKKGKGADAANSQSGKNAAGSGVGGVNNSGESEGTAYSWLKDKITGKNNAGNKNQADGSSQNNGKSNADSDGSNSDGSNGSNNDKDGQEVDSKWDKEDIVHRPEKSIFKIVSKRYFRSAYPVLLDISIFKKTGQ